MQSETVSHSPASRPPAVSPLGILFLHSPRLMLRVRYGSLDVTLGLGQTLTVSKASEPRLRRLVLAGHGGMVSLEAFAWLRGIGASWCHLDLYGAILGMGPGDVSPNLAGLRRRQAAAAGGHRGLAIGRELLAVKLAGQAHNLDSLPGGAYAADSIRRHAETLDLCQSVPELRSVEAAAAAAWWDTVAALPVGFLRADEPTVPPEWRTVGRRSSTVTGTPRGASNPAHSVWNMAYSLAASEVTVSLRACGLDPGISPTGLHTDVPNRDSASFDLVEAVRPTVDGMVLSMFAGRRFRRRDFAVAPDGRVRLTAPLARELSEAIIPAVREAAGPVAEGVARSLAGGDWRLPSNLTGEARSRGRDGIRRKAIKQPTTTKRMRAALVPAACLSCGIVLEGTGRRRYCDSCLPTAREAARTAQTVKLTTAGRATLAKMRSSPGDPARTPAARAKMTAGIARQRAEAQAWDREHERPDPAEWDTILPSLATVTLAAIQEATGLSIATASKIRKGERRPHPRHWPALAALGSRCQRQALGCR